MDAKLVDKNEFGVELRWANRGDTWPGWDIPLKRGYWFGNDRGQTYLAGGKKIFDKYLRGGRMKTISESTEGVVGETPARLGV